MSEFLTTSGVAHHLENIIIESKNKLFLVSPYLKLSKTFLERLHDASNNGVTIKIIYGKDKLNPSEMISLSTIKNLELYFSQNLHAKCYFNESKMLITSMNLYEFSEKNNREMGILITRQTDSHLFEKAIDEVKSIIQSSTKINDLSSENKSITSNIKIIKHSPNLENKTGYCIRCEKKILLDESKPYCPDCFSVWAEYQNSSYEENVCHNCGQQYDSSMDDPLCDDCFDVDSDSDDDFDD